MSIVILTDKKNVTGGCNCFCIRRMYTYRTPTMHDWSFPTEPCHNNVVSIGRQSSDSTCRIACENKEMWFDGCKEEKV